MVSDYDQSSFVCFGSWHMWKILAYMENTVVVFLLVLNGKMQTSWIIPKLKENSNGKHQNVHDVKCLQFLAEAAPAPSHGDFRMLDLAVMQMVKKCNFMFLQRWEQSSWEYSQISCTAFKIGDAFA